MHHAAFQRKMDALDVVVVEDSRPMQTILRSILSACGVARLRVYDRAEQALKDMLVEPPHVLITDWRMEPMSGFRLVRTIRHKSLEPLCFTPAIMVTGHATRAFVDRAFRIGVHQLMVKPIAPAALQKRLHWLAGDDRTYTLRGDRYVIDGVAQILDERLERSNLHEKLRGIVDLAEPGPAPPEAEAEEAGEAGAPVSDAGLQPAPVAVHVPRQNRSVQAELDASVWGG